ncbi:hypothetical protein [Streptomyces exfoliatus]|uniref:hypothetical protein n=1 Tax=Streptomyces exfoliatus TaxID=1905 RepID=UPI003C2F5105
MALLLYELRRIGMASTCRRLAERTVPRVALEDPDGVSWLLDELRQAGFQDLVEAVLARDPVAEAVLDTVRPAMMLLWSLEYLGRMDLVRRLALRDLPYVVPDDAEYTASFLDVVARVGDAQDVMRFAERVVEEVEVSHVPRLGFLARSLWDHHAPGPLARLADRAVAGATPRTSSSFLDLLRMLRAYELDAHVDALIERIAEHPQLADPVTHTNLLRELRAAAETEAADRLEAIAPRNALSPTNPTNPTTETTTPPAPRGHRPYGLETNGVPALPWTWRDLDRPHAAPPQPRHTGAATTDADPWDSWHRYADN